LTFVQDVGESLHLHYLRDFLPHLNTASWRLPQSVNSKVISFGNFLDRVIQVEAGAGEAFRGCGAWQPAGMLDWLPAEGAAGARSFCFLRRGQMATLNQPVNLVLWLSCYQIEGA
jgi:hypothetical protein